MTQEYLPFIIWKEQYKILYYNNKTIRKTSLLKRDQCNILLRYGKDALAITIKKSAFYVRS